MTASSGTFIAKPDKVVFKKNLTTYHNTVFLIVYSIAPGNGRTLEGNDSVRTAFQVIEDANSDVGNLRSMYTIKYLVT